MRFLVTGGAGFIGAHLVNRLLRFGGVEVRSFDNESRGRFPAASVPRVESIPGDIRNTCDLRRAMNGCEVVFHLAAAATVMDCERRQADAHESNVTGTFNVLRIAQETGVGRVVVASSREVYGEAVELPVSESTPIRPKNVYGATKAAAEMYCSWASSNLQVSVLRLTNVYGPGDVGRVIPLFLSAAEKNLPLTLYGGNQVIDFISVGHVVDAFVNAGLKSYVSGPVNIGSGQGTTIQQAAKRVIALCNSSSAVEILPARNPEVSRFVADVTRMTRELGIAAPLDPLEHLALMCCPVADTHLPRPASQVQAAP